MQTLVEGRGVYQSSLTEIMLCNNRVQSSECQDQFLLGCTDLAGLTGLGVSSLSIGLSATGCISFAVCLSASSRGVKGTEYEGEQPQCAGTFLAFFCNAYSHCPIA